MCVHIYIYLLLILFLWRSLTNTILFHIWGDRSTASKDQARLEGKSLLDKDGDQDGTRVLGGGWRAVFQPARGQARSLSSSRSCGSPVPAMPGGRRASPGWQELTHHMTVPSPNYTPAAAAAAKSLQSCPTLCDPLDGSPPGSAIPGILQARTLEWVAISFSVHAGSKVQIKSIPWKIHLISKSCTC